MGAGISVCGCETKDERLYCIKEKVDFFLFHSSPFSRFKLTLNGPDTRTGAKVDNFLRTVADGSKAYGRAGNNLGHGVLDFLAVQFALIVGERIPPFNECLIPAVSGEEMSC